MLYVDYHYYTEVYHGKLEQSAFESGVTAACRYIDKITYQRLRNGAPVTDDVKMAVCAVLDVMSEQQTDTSPTGITSENVDGYSVSYQSGIDQEAYYAARCKHAADLYLPLSDPLRYAGVCAC